MTPEILWMLRRAFGPPGADSPEVDPDRALGLCRRFELAGRVAARQGRARLAGELGEAGAAGFLREQVTATGEGLRLAALAEEVARTAAARGIPIVFLKGAALELAGVLAPGSRPACDVDVLAPPEEAAGLQAGLTGLGETGLAASGMPGLEHQLPALAGASGAVEVHRMLPGVRLAGRRSATLPDLSRADLLVPLPDVPGRTFRPAPALAVAHALVHGLGQHGWWPRSYALFKMVGDLADLGLGGPEGEALAATAGAWIAADVPPAETAAMRRLVQTLVSEPAADLAGWGSSPEPAALLLRHLLAGRLDPGYERALRLGLFRAQPSDRPAPLRLARTLFRTVFLTREQVDALYGPPRGGGWGYLGRRLWRPIDLAGRLARSSRAAWKSR
jgi:Uncharacterised nucleotidyltransferase